MSSLGNVTYLFHHTPPLDLGPEPTILVADGDGNVARASLESLSRLDMPLVTHSFALLADWFRKKGLALPRRVVDLESAKKLAVGHPKSAFEKEKPWDMWSMFRHSVPDRYDAANVKSSLASHMSLPGPTDFSNLRWMVPAC